MLRKTRNTILAVSFALVAMTASSMPVAAQSNYYLNFRMENNTGYNIDQVHLSSVSDSSFERDLLGNGVFYNGTSFTITQITPGQYDMKLVDQDADVCVVHDVAIYSNTDWNLTQQWLLNCER